MRERRSVPSMLTAAALTARNWLGYIDGRARILGTVWLAAWVTVEKSVAALLLLIGIHACLLLAAGIRRRALQARFTTINLFSLLLLGLMPWGTSGTPLFHWGVYGYTREGLAAAWLIVLKVNTILLVITLWLSTLDPLRFGRALERLWVSPILVRVFLLTLRYLDTMRSEWERLYKTLQARAFAPRLNLHTLRVYGTAFATLFLRAFYRAERVYAAMRCRGFSGRFPPAPHESLSAYTLGFIGYLVAATALSYFL